MEAIRADAADGVLRQTRLAWDEVFREALAISAAHSSSLGTRSLDVLHVAAARVGGADEFLTLRRAPVAPRRGDRNPGRVHPPANFDLSPVHSSPVETGVDFLAEELGFPIQVCHLPPATSKWNKIERRLFSFISLNWRGRPLVSHEVIVNLIKATSTAKGLRVDAQIDSKISRWPEGKRSGIHGNQLGQRRVSRRLELHDRSSSATASIVTLISLQALCGNVASLGNNFFFDGDTPETLTLSNLTPSQSYNLDLYSFAFGTPGEG